MKFQAHYLTDVGRTRSHNEDFAHSDPEAGLLVVADGMGGHGAGEVASELATNAVVGAIGRFVSGEEPAPVAEAVEPAVDDEERTVQAMPNPVIQVVNQAVSEANQAVYNENKSSGFADGIGMGTTLVGLWRLGSLREVALFQVGDSRIYLFRDGKLLLLTRDHTAYQEWERNGRTGPAPPGNLILRAVGLFPEVKADVRIQSVHPGDVFLLCSDGLTAMLDDGEIENYVREGSEDPQELNARLVSAANARGGHDNITVITARFDAA
ncbi:protein phosphatase 2C domain-containing protein [Granulosicoccaceae sp. 1_MG-2023]|nr:protein phosphatase 2C domain-containing protein [Granulosicoccaceae sp. 1_MG-2023]